MSFVLSLYGDGPLRPQLEALAVDSGGAVRIQRPVPHEQVPSVLAQAQVGVTSLPEPDDAKYEASSPIKLFEYMAAGMPVLATDSKCHTDVVGDGRFAFLGPRHQRRRHSGCPARYMGPTAWTCVCWATKRPPRPMRGPGRRPRENYTAPSNTV